MLGRKCPIGHGYMAGAFCTSCGKPTVAVKKGERVTAKSWLCSYCGDRYAAPPRFCGGCGRSRFYEK